MSIEVHEHQQDVRQLHRPARRRRLTVADGRTGGPARARPARARPRCCGSSPGWRRPTRAAVAVRTTRTSPDRDASERSVGFVFQHYALFRHMTVFENIAFGLRVRPRQTRPPTKRDPRDACTELLRAGAARRARRPLSVAAFRRPAAARRAGPGAGRRAEGAAARRAVRRARRQGAQGAAPLAAPAARRDARHQRLRHARPGRGAGSGRPRRGDERTAASSRSARRTRCTHTPRTPSSTAFLGPRIVSTGV